jgi:hypothetical protein
LLLGQSGQRTESALAALTNALHDEDIEVRLQAISALAGWGRAARPAVPDLAALLKDSDSQDAFYADISLWNIDEAAAVEACGWRPFTSDRWDFTAVFPAAPSEEQTPAPVPGAGTQYAYGALHGAMYCSVAVTEYAADWVATVPEDRRFDAAREGARAALDGKLLREAPVEQSGLHGREVVIDVEGKAVFESRMFWVGRRFYRVSVSCSPKFLNRKAADHFLNSFRAGPAKPEPPAAPSPPR